MMKADVYKHGTHAATLELVQNDTVFTYRPTYGGPPIATTLPVSGTPQVFANGALPPFFAAMLPEGPRLEVLSRHVATKQPSELALLLEIGGDVSGDVQIVPAGTSPSTPIAKAVLTRDAVPKFSTLRAHASPVDHIGIAGFQDKVSAKTPDRSAHILKLQEPRFPHLVENEAFFLTLARHAGLTTTNYEVISDFTGETALLIERFDRVSGSRFAFEDASQVLDIWPEQKYHVPAEEACLALISHCTDKLTAAHTLFQQIAFAVITGNGDQHAKNLGILQQPSGEWRVSPAYDLPATVPYGDYTLALPVMGQRENVSRRAMISFGEELGLPKAFAERELDSLLDKTEPALANIRESGLPFDPTRFHHFDRHLRARRRNLRS